jgi:DNA (cytosine-5)-methyltransferase 1
MLKFGSVCSGIEAASVAWEPLGWKAAWLSEIEPFPSAVLKHHYPNVPNLGDMTTLPERILSGEVEAPDLFCGGTPCQAFSVAGLRKSLGDARGNLSLTFCEIANAIDDIRSVRGLPASIVFWENVPGVLSTTDNAFGCFLAALVGGDEPLNAPDGWPNAGCVDGPQRSAAWRVLDAQYFGVAQRRRRVFVVASARDGFDPAKVLFEFDGVRRDIAPSRETRQTVTGTIEASLGRSRGAGTPTSAVVEQPYDVGNCLTARMHKGINSTVDEGQTPVIALQDVTPREKAQNGKGWNDDGVSYTVDAAATQGVAQPLNIYGGNKRADRPEGGFYVRLNEDTSKTLDAASGLNPTCAQGGTAVIQAMAVRRLTPVECERLQGFPDGYTDIKDKCPDGPRYKALGNSWAVPVVAWIGRRIQENIRVST